MGTPPISLRDTGGECDTRFVTVTVDVFNPSVILTPPSLRTPPLYFATQNIGEVVNTLRCIVFVFLPYISVRKYPVVLRGTARAKDKYIIISLDKIMSQKGVKTPPLLCSVASRGCFSLLSYFKTPPLCFATQNIGEVSRSDGGVWK